MNYTSGGSLRVPFAPGFMAERKPREIDDRPLLLLYGDNPSENRVDTRLPRNFLNKSAFSPLYARFTHALEMQRHATKNE